MAKKQSFQEAKAKLSNKFSYLKLLTYNGANNLCKIYDIDFGEFECKYNYALQGKKSHPLRGKINRENKRKVTCLEKYGTTNPLKNKDIYNKVKQTNIKKYGHHCSLLNEEVRKKTNQTNLEKYGVENPIQSTDVVQFRRENNIKKYGVIHPLKLEQFYYKVKDTCIKKYGVANISYLQSVKNKIVASFEKSNMEKYGVKYTTLLIDVKDKIKQSNINNGHYHNIDGYTLADYYRNSNISNYRSYSCLQQNYIKFNDLALNINFYDQIIRISIKSNIWLNQIEEELGYSLIREYHIQGTLYHADGYDPITNTVYEFYGDYWHGYPFKNLGINKHCDNSFNTLYYKTIDRETIIGLLGYNIITMWENA